MHFMYEQLPPNHCRNGNKLASICIDLLAIPSSRDQGMSFDVQNGNLLWETAYIKVHGNCKLPQPLKSIFSVQPNRTRKVTFVPIDGSNNLMIKGFQHQ